MTEFNSATNAGADPLTRGFEANRAHLRAVAYRMLGSISDADDAVQEAWLRFSRADAAGVDNLSGWLTTVVGRVCLDMLRSRRSRREDPLDHRVAEPPASGQHGGDPEYEALLADSVGPALLVVLDTLAPAERLAFVLHDLFAVPFDEIAPIVGRTSDATRQLASRARRRVRGAPVDAAADRSRQREVVDAFLAAARGGDFNALLAMLDPEVMLRADQIAVGLGAMSELRGARAVAEAFAGRAQAARPALVNGAAGAALIVAGKLRFVFEMTFAHDRIAAIELIADPERIHGIDLIIIDSNAH